MKFLNRGRILFMILLFFLAFIFFNNYSHNELASVLFVSNVDMAASSPTTECEGNKCGIPYSLEKAEIGICTTINGGLSKNGGSPVVSSNFPKPGTGVTTGKEHTKQDYATWVKNGGRFRVWEWDYSDKPSDYYAWYVDEVVNRAYLYLIYGDNSDKEYAINKILDWANKNEEWDIYTSARYLADIAEAYLAFRDKGLFSDSQKNKIESWLKDRAIKAQQGYRAQSVIAGLNAVVGYIIQDNELLNFANTAISYDDTWTIPEDSTHYQALIIPEMIRIAIFTNNRNMPNSLKENFKKQMNWILDTFPHNGYNPPYGDVWRQSGAEGYMYPLVASSHFLADYDPETAQNCKWLLDRMFIYGFNKNIYYYAAQQRPYWYKINPIWFYWYLNDNINSKKPDINKHGSKVVYRYKYPLVGGDSTWDSALNKLENQFDKIIHRNSWDDDALFLMLDPVHKARKNFDLGYANSIISISYGAEEFLTGRVQNWKTPKADSSYLHSNVVDIYGDRPDKYGAELELFEDKAEYSKSITSYGEWKRTITMYKGNDPKIVVEDYLPRAGNVYWHLQGQPTWSNNHVLLNNNEVKLKVEYSGFTSSSHRDISTWSRSDGAARWTYSGDVDHELKIYRDGAGTITTTFEPIESTTGSIEDITEDTLKKIKKGDKSD